jgi:hypothetical protein
LGIPQDYTPLVVGGSQNSIADNAADHFAAPMDEVVFYDRALSNADMAALAVGFRPMPR